jgi:hypothetical protein
MSFNANIIFIVVQSKNFFLVVDEKNKQAVTFWSSPRYLRRPSGDMLICQQSLSYNCEI